MTNRVVVNVASDSWVTGQRRLAARLSALGERLIKWTDVLPTGCPPHRTAGNLAAPAQLCIPYAFKSYALMEAARGGFTSLLWADSCIYPVRSLEPMWEKIEADGVVVCRNGYWNAEWCADSWYADCYPGVPLEEARADNWTIPHPVATAFGLSLAHPIGREILKEYHRYASSTRAFCGPWQNSNAPTVAGRNSDRYAAPCGPPEVSGHRHDQSVLGIILHRLGVKLVDPPKYFCYLGSETEETVLVADGGLVLR